MAASVVCASKHSMRRCMLLPVADSVDGSVGFKVFEELEGYLKSSSWCYYESNSSIMSILGNYRRDLHAHLKNPEVLKLIADKIGAGSLIRVEIIGQVSGMLIKLEVVGENGRDVYFNESEKVETADTFLIARKIKNWLEVYETKIPHHGLVKGVLGNQITVDIGKASHVRIGNEFTIRRVVKKKQHPLLKEIVEWESILIARGKIYNVSEYQAQGAIKVYYSKSKAQKNDWVRIEEDKSPMMNTELKYPDVKANEFGKLGTLSMTMDIGPGSTSTTVTGTNAEIGGNLIGFSLRSELWATRNWFGALGFGRRFTTYKTETGSPASSSNSITSTHLKFAGGYKFLPLGFFYGPQIDFYAGYGVHSYGMDSSAADGFGDHSIRGILFGIKANAPVYTDVRIFARADLLPKAGYSEDSNINGDADSASSFQFEIGGNYQYNPVVSLDASLELTSNKADFKAASRELEQKESVIKLGGTFSF